MALVSRGPTRRAKATNTASLKVRSGIDPPVGRQPRERGSQECALHKSVERCGAVGPRRDRPQSLAPSTDITLGVEEAVRHPWNPLRGGSNRTVAPAVVRVISLSAAEASMTTVVVTRRGRRTHCEARRPRDGGRLQSVSQLRIAERSHPRSSRPRRADDWVAAALAMRATKALSRPSRRGFVVRGARRRPCC